MTIDGKEIPFEDERLVATLAPLSLVMKKGVDRDRVGIVLGGIFKNEKLSTDLIAGIGRQINRGIKNGAIGFEEALLIAESIPLSIRQGEAFGKRLLTEASRNKNLWSEPQEVYFPLAAETAMINLNQFFGIYRFKDIFLSRLAQLEQDDPVQIEARLVIARSLSRLVDRLVAKGGEFEERQAELFEANKKYFEVAGLEVLRNKIAGWMEEEAADLRKETYYQQEKSDEALKILQSFLKEAPTRENEIREILIKVAQEVYQRASRLSQKHEGEALNHPLNLLTTKGLSKIIYFYSPADRTRRKEILLSLINFKPAEGQPLDSFVVDYLPYLIRESGLSKSDEQELIARWRALHGKN